MIVGVCTISLQLPACASLKHKRQVLRSLLSRVHREFNVAATEVDDHDRWQAAIIGISCVSTSAGHAHGLLERVVQFVARDHTGVVVLDYETELL